MRLSAYFLVLALVITHFTDAKSWQNWPWVNQVKGFFSNVKQSVISPFHRQLTSTLPPFFQHSALPPFRQQATLQPRPYYSYPGTRYGKTWGPQTPNSKVPVGTSTLLKPSPPYTHDERFQKDAANPVLVIPQGRDYPLHDCQNQSGDIKCIKGTPFIGGRHNEVYPSTQLHPSSYFENASGCTTLLGDPGLCVEHCKNTGGQELLQCKPNFVCCPENKKELRECEKYHKRYGMEQMAVKVANGQKASRGEFPHMIALYSRGNLKTFDNTSYLCGGIIITEFYILTAAHCFKLDRNPDHYLMMVGTFDLALRGVAHEPHSKWYEAAQVLCHEQYNASLPSGSGYHDIGLIRTKQEILFNNLVYPACLFLQDEVPGNYKEVTVCGWGGTDKSTEPVNQLRTGHVDLLDRTSCRDEYKSDKFSSLKHFFHTITNTLVCTISRKKAAKMVDTCRGDSGGPLQFRHGETFYVVGVTSHGLTCPSYFGLYTRVSAYIHWIKNVVGQLP